MIKSDWMIRRAFEFVQRYVTDMPSGAMGGVLAGATAPDPKAARETTWRRLSNLFGGSAGNFVEWFDWFTYASFAIYFSKAFFPESNQTVQLLSSAVIFAVGFLMRPIGALVMGSYADKAGRRAALALSVGLMSAGSLMVALIPTGLGILSTLLLVFARLIQGLSVGGEYGASATYVSETARRDSRGFWSGWLYVTVIGGQLSALLLQVVLQHFLSEKELYAWGWRIPFAVGATMGLIVFWIRLGIDETQSFANASTTATARGKSRQLFTRHPKETAIVFILTAGGSIGLYTYAIYMQKFLVNTTGFGKATASQLMVLVLITFMLLQPAVGWISDKVGRRPTLMVSYGAGAILAVPVLTAISKVTDPVTAYFLCVLPLVFLSGYTSLSAIIKAELFPAEVRALGVALPYAIAQAVFGGNAETAALSFKQARNESGYYWLLAGILAIGFVVTLLMFETKTHSRILED